MPATDAFKNSVANAAVALGASVSLHTASPGTTGANEVTGGGYARKTTTWGSSTVPGSGGDAGKAVVTGSAQTFDIPAGSTITHFGVWNGSTFLWGDVISPNLTFTGAAGQAQVTPYYKYTQA